MTGFNPKFMERDTTKDNTKTTQTAPVQKGSTFGGKTKESDTPKPSETKQESNAPVGLHV